MKYGKSINISLGDLLEESEKVYIIGEDLIDPYGGAFKITKGLSTKYPERVLSTPISEAAIVGMSGGMAIGGLRPIVEIMFGDFFSLSYDQLLNHLTKYAWMYNEQVKVPVTIRTAMGGGRGYGPTHSQSIEPILANIPQLKIISPSDYHNPGNILKYSVMEDDCVKVFTEHKLLYPRNLKNNGNLQNGLNVQYSSNKYPTAYISNCNFQIPELVIITHGGNSIIVEDVMMELLVDYELNAESILPSLIRPIPYSDILDKIKDVPYLIFLEESPVAYGWSSEIISYLLEANQLEGKIIKRFGAKELPIPSAIHLEKKVLPSKELIISYIKGNMLK